MISNTPYIYTRAALAAAVAVSATLFAGCSSASDAADTPAVDAHAITFNATDGTTDAQESTRATAQVGLETLGYTEIKVYGYKTIGGEIQNVMPGYTLKYVENSENSSTTNSSGWEYVGQGKDYLNNEQEIKYWDGNSTDYRFFGVIAARNGDLRYEGAEITENTVVTSNGSFSLEIKGLEYMTHTSDGTYHDRDGNVVAKNAIPIYGTLWQGNPAQYYNTPVPLAFTKPYALVRVVFERPEGTSKTQLGKENETGTDLHPITFAPLNSTPMTAEGKVKVNWSMNGAHETATATAGQVTLPKMTFDSPVNLVNQGVRYQAWPEYIMIPSKDDPVVFKCTAYTYTVNTSGGEVFEERSAVVPAQYMKWKPGYQYTYVFKITATNAMEFSHVVEVYTQWQAGYVDTTTW